MKKKLLPIALMGAALLVTSCHDDDVYQGTATSAKISAPDSDNGQNGVVFYWENGDSIYMQTNTPYAYYRYDGAKFTAQTESASQKTNFSGEVPSGATLGRYAVYPYNQEHRFTAETSLYYNLPATYTHTCTSSRTTDQGDSDTRIAYSTSRMPMVGLLTGESVAFNPVGAVFVLTVEKMPSATGTLTMTSDQKLSGNFLIRNVSAEDAAMKTSQTVHESERQVAFSYTQATEGQSETFYLPVATGQFENIYIRIFDGTRTRTAKIGNLTTTRGGMIAILIGEDQTTVKYEDGFKQIENTTWEEETVANAEA